MTPKVLFSILILILVIDFAIGTWLDILNARHFDDELPQELQDVYDEKEYLRSQRYKKVNDKFGMFQSIFSLLVVLDFFFFNGFAFVDNWARTITTNPIFVALIFFGIILLGLAIIMLPFNYYSIFVIEEKFGFNKMTKKTFWLDKIKGGILSSILGGGILALIIWFYELVGSEFWIYAWLLIAAFSFFMLLFYSKFIVPIFNKQTPLETGPLRDKIEEYAKKVGFQLSNIYVIDGSKRSTKANAYFSGFGKQKRITLFDTLIQDLDDDEIVAVLAHEVGHYKHNHTIYTLLISIFTMGITLWLLSLFIASPLLSQALGVTQPSFHIGLIVFFILYSPISEVSGLLMNKLSRKFEYQADHYAKKTYHAAFLISSLKKLSRKSLSNLTPAKAYVNFHYSHPTLLQRIKKLRG